MKDMELATQSTHSQNAMRELAAHELGEVNGGLVWFFIGALAVFDAGLWGYIAGKRDGC